MKEARVSEILNQRGYQTEVIPVIKNGIKMQGISVKIADVMASPTFYINKMDDMTDEEIADKLEYQIENAEPLDINVAHIGDKDYILSKVIPAIQQRSEEDIVKFPMCDLEIYFRVVVAEGEGMASYKVKQSLLDSAGIDAGDLMSHAMENIRPHIYIKSLAEIMSERFGFDIGDDMVPLYVMSTDFQSFGAGAVLDTEKIADVAKRLGAERLAILPSSIHEVLLYKMDADTDTDELSMLVQSVNSDVVEPEDYLSDGCYIYENGTITRA